MKLKRQGYFKEMNHSEEKDPSILDYINNKIEDKTKICKYLSEGVVLAACGEVVEDVLNPDNGIIGSPDAVTDGEWLWPADLVYYVEKYNLKLPDEFVESMKKNNWIIPISDNDLLLEEIEVV